MYISNKKLQDIKNLADVKKPKYPRRTEVTIVYKYGKDDYKIVTLKSVAEKGLEKKTIEQDELEEYKKAIEKIETEIFNNNANISEVSCETYKKLDESISRAKRVVYELARCNKWQYFVTLTLDGRKTDRYCSPSEFMKKFKKMNFEMNKQVTGEKWGRQEMVKYLLVPEFHKDGALHFHGFLGGLHKSDVRINEHNYPEWKQYRDKFGFCNMSRIENIKACSAYAMKYMSKDIMKTVTEKGAHMYYHSRGLDKPIKIYEGHAQYLGEYDYSHPEAYCKIAYVNEAGLIANLKLEGGKDICGNYFA